MSSKSLWMNIDVMPAAEPLAGDRDCDVAVVGSGIAGISTAYELCKQGKSVIVIDRGRIAGGMTSRTSAHLAPLCDDLVSEMTSIKGLEATRLFCESQAAAIDRIEETQKTEKIDCDFRRLDGYLFQGRGMPADTIDKELEAVRDVGAPVDRLMGVPFNGCEKRHVLRYPRQATFHPLQYLAGVAKACVDSGVTFYADTPVESISEDDGIVSVKTAGGTIRAKHTVIATNSSISDLVAIHTKTAPYRTYVMAFELKRGALPDALYWDTEEPYHYVRLQHGPGRMDYVLVGGEDHMKAAKNFVVENTTAVKSFAEYVALGELTKLDDLKPGHGAIVREGLKKIAAYRDDQGALHLNSASCSHVGCHLHFNSFETCWDCPCHGSIFNVEGQPINAPAIRPLEKFDR
jgi:glycine/D-amino acid oxidase-like deaminating enzyme